VIGKLVILLTPSTVIPSHSSVAVGVVMSVAVISHSSVRSGKGSASGVGPVVSSIITCCVWVLIFPVESVYVHVIVVDSVIGKLVTLLTPSTVTPSHSSVAVGVVMSVAVISHSSVRSGKGSASGVGPVESSITTSCVCVVKFPEESVYVHVIVVDAVIGKAVSLTH
jgi:predicted RecA/RadA family phage recombinase